MTGPSTYRWSNAAVISSQSFFFRLPACLAAFPLSLSFRRRTDGRGRRYLFFCSNASPTGSYVCARPVRPPAIVAPPLQVTLVLGIGWTDGRTDGRETETQTDRRMAWKPLAR